MTYPKELQAYYDAHDVMMDWEHKSFWDVGWARAFGLYKIARYNAVKAHLLPETPEFG